jgi:hypothetical protein
LGFGIDPAVAIMSGEHAKSRYTEPFSVRTNPTVPTTTRRQRGPASWRAGVRVAAARTVLAPGYERAGRLSIEQACRPEFSGCGLVSDDCPFAAHAR